MKTKKLFYFVMALAVASLFASCKKNNNENGTTASVGFKATTELRSGTSRTLGVPNEAGSAMSVQWINGDQILIANQGGADGCDKLTYSLASGDHSTKGNFTSRDEDDDFLQPDYVAIYPATNTNDVANDIVKEGDDLKAVFNLPATQDFQRNSFAEKAMPMVAYSSEQELEFKNVLGGICFPLVGEGMTVTKIILASADPNEVLWGECKTTISTSDADPTSVVSNEDANKNCITLNCGSGIALGTNPTDFYIMVPAGTLETGFTVEAFNGETSVYSKSADWSANPQENFISRSVIRKVDHNLEIIHELDVTTISPTYITMNSAKAEGTVEVADGLTLVACGICYLPVSPSNANAMPVIDGTGVVSVTATTGTSFTVNLTGLQKDQMYAVRAWAKDDNDVYSYGEPILFATRKDYVNDYGGRIPFPFSVSSDRKVNFSMGNLFYLGTGDNGTMTPQWRFADYQYQYMADGVQEGEMPSYMPSFANYSPSRYNSDSENVTEEMKSARDLFCWGTSGWNSGAASYQPYQPYAIYSHDSDYYPGGDYTNDLVGTYAQADWGVYNAIENGGQQAGMWRVLTGGESGEWQYLVNGRTSETCRFLQTAIYPLQGYPIPLYGAILFPDGFVWPSYVKQLDNVNSFGSLTTDIVGLLTGDFSSLVPHTITEAEWSLLEQIGAVFLPATGYRASTVVWDGAEAGYYSSTHNDEDNAWAFSVNLFTGIKPNETYHRKLACTVRLVCPATQTTGGFNNQPFGVNP